MVNSSKLKLNCCQVELGHEYQTLFIEMYGYINLLYVPNNI